MLLTLAGVGEVRIADFDTLADHNLHRQILFKESDIGLPKVEGALRELTARNSDTKVVAFKEKIDKSNFARFPGRGTRSDCGCLRQCRKSLNHLQTRA